MVPTTFDFEERLSMKYFTVLALAAALAACGQEPADTSGPDSTANSEEMTAQTDNSEKVMAALETCKTVEANCGEGAVGYLVFPDVTSVALGVGGQGGNGALVENGQIVSNWRMGEATIGLQAGIDAASYVFKFTDQAALDKYKTDGEWSIGAEGDITIAEAGATAQGETGGPTLYVFNSEGLMADVSVGAMKVWRTDEISGEGTDAMNEDGMAEDDSNM